MEDSELCLVMSLACDLMPDFPLWTIAQLLDSRDEQRIDNLLGKAFPLQRHAWSSLAGAEAATAMSLVAAMVDGGEMKSLVDVDRIGTVFGSATERRQ